MCLIENWLNCFCSDALPFPFPSSFLYPFSLLPVLPVNTQQSAYLMWLWEGRKERDLNVYFGFELTQLACAQTHTHTNIHKLTHTLTLYVHSNFINGSLGFMEEWRDGCIQRISVLIEKCCAYDMLCILWRGNLLTDVRYEHYKVMRSLISSWPDLPIRIWLV